MCNDCKYYFYDNITGASDWIKLFQEHGGFELIEIFEMEHQAKKNYWMNTSYDKETYQGFKEPIMSFRKVK